MKNKLQPTRTSFSRNFQCKKAPRWLRKFFSFWYRKSGGPVKKTTLYMSLSCGVKMISRVFLLFFWQQLKHHNWDNVLIYSLSSWTKKSRLSNLVIINKYSSTGGVPLSRINMEVVLRLEELKAADWTGGRGVGGSSWDFVFAAFVRIGCSLQSASFGGRQFSIDICLVSSTRKISFISYTDLIVTNL